MAVDDDDVLAERIERIGFDMTVMVHPRGVDAALAVKDLIAQAIGGMPFGSGCRQAHVELAEPGERHWQIKRCWSRKLGGFRCHRPSCTPSAPAKELHREDSLTQWTKRAMIYVPQMGEERIGDREPGYGA